MYWYNFGYLAPSAISIKKTLLLILFFSYLNINANFEELTDPNQSVFENTSSTKKINKKKLTIIFYFAGVNNLGFFLRRNLTQLCKWTSNENINILVQFIYLI